MSFKRSIFFLVGLMIGFGGQLKAMVELDQIESFFVIKINVPTLKDPLLSEARYMGEYLAGLTDEGVKLSMQMLRAVFLRPDLPANIFAPYAEIICDLCQHPKPAERVGEYSRKLLKRFLSHSIKDFLAPLPFKSLSSGMPICPTLEEQICRSQDFLIQYFSEISAAANALSEGEKMYLGFRLSQSRISCEPAHDESLGEHEARVHVAHFLHSLWPRFNYLQARELISSNRADLLFDKITKPQEDCFYAAAYELRTSIMFYAYLRRMSSPAR